jgi:hypothetical protein
LRDACGGPIRLHTALLEAGRLAEPVLSSNDSFRSGFGPEAVPEVGARPLFLWS